MFDILLSLIMICIFHLFIVTSEHLNQSICGVSFITMFFYLVKWPNSISDDCQFESTILTIMSYHIVYFTSVTRGCIVCYHKYPLFLVEDRPGSFPFWFFRGLGLLIELSSNIFYWWVKYYGQWFIKFEMS